MSAGRPATWLHAKSSSRSGRLSGELPCSMRLRSSMRALASANDWSVPTLQLNPALAKRSRAVTASFFQRTSPS